MEINGLGLEGDLTRQGDVYRDIVRAYLKSSGCTAIQNWGFRDKYSWVGSHSHRTCGAGVAFCSGLSTESRLPAEFGKRSPRDARPLLTIEPLTVNAAPSATESCIYNGLRCIRLQSCLTYSA